MAPATLLSFLLLLVLSTSAHAQPRPCPALSRVEKDGQGVSTCRCGTGLKNLTLTPPKGLELRAACHLREGEGFVDIPKSQSVNLDQYDSRGNSPIGNYYFRGRMRISGVLRFEPSDGGELFFWPAQPVEMPDSTIEPSFRMLTLIPQGRYATFSVTKSIRAMDCAEARAEIVIHEVRVIVNDSDEAGAYPTKLDLLRISPYKPCKRN